MFSKKITMHTKKQEYEPFKGRNKSKEIVFEKELMADELDKDLQSMGSQRVRYA